MPSSSAALAPSFVLVRHVLRGLAAPRRAVPLGLFAVFCTLLELSWTPTWSVALYSLVLCVSFMVLAPLSWCALSGSLLGQVAHCLLGGLWTIVFGVALRHGLGMRMATLATDPTGLWVLTAGFSLGGYSIGRDLQLEHALVRAEADARHAQLLALRAQLDPHFLFNTLNAIAEWCRDAPDVAEQALLRLAGMLRSILEAIKEPTWALGRELAMAEDLVALYRVRDPERFVLRAQVDALVADAQVPPLLVLGLVENAIKHGPGAGRVGPIELDARRVGSMLVLRVQNPGPFLGPREGGEGLLLVERRLAQAYGTRARFTIDDDTHRTTAQLVLPHAPGATAHA